MENSAKDSEEDIEEQVDRRPKLAWFKESKEEVDGDSDDSDYYSQTITSTKLRFSKDNEFELIDYYYNYYSGAYSGGSTKKKILTGKYTLNN